MRRVQRGVEAGDPGVEVADLAGEHERLLGLDRQAPITVGVADQRSLSSSRRARLVTPHKLGATQPPEPIRAKTSWSPGWRQDSSASCRWSPSQGVTGKEELLVDC